ncbi:hypothetical protein [Acinetobacter bereziniae]|uniref:hypothetical protein n=1 Tax=Acinetobacter bereziniae TaxID=106648 RepID=UPI0011167509|nr:hypothetical protein [Acinetobacter bereziniae]TNL47919.1 hypothetical protein EYB59_14380 [Acinetobacter bereziniae]TNL58197.1 hypothetical protein EYY58_12345 [Acinetobacter bereziniae]
MSQINTTIMLESSIEIKLGNNVEFQHSVPFDGASYGLMTNNVDTNRKLKQILENALAQIEISLKSNS